MKLTVTASPTGKTGISPRLASNFIELGYGWQVECMQAEMFFNRSFEPFYPYREINKLWYDLHENPDDPATPLETDWRVFDWCHSGYEHNAWFAFPGTAGYSRITDDASFLIEKSPTAPVTIGYTDAACHGESAMRVENGSDSAGGLAQEGKYCRAGVSYLFKGKIRLTDGSALIINLLNRTETPETVELDLTAFSVPDGVCPGVRLAAPSLLSMNTLTDRPITEQPDELRVEGGVIRAEVKGLSFGEYRAAVQ